MTKIYAFVGASGSGKTTILRHLGNQEERSGVFAGMSERHGTVVPYKPSTRQARPDDFEITQGPIPKRDSYHYKIQGNRYAIRRADLERALEQDLSPALVVNDIPTIERMKDNFGPGVVVPIYIHSNTTAERITELQRQRGEFAQGNQFEMGLDVVRRAEKLVSVHEDRVFMPEFFPHTILNTGTPEQLYSQVDAVVAYERQRAHDRSSRAPGPKVMPIDAASGTGRGTLLREALDQLPGDVSVAMKYTTRAPKARDDPRLITCGPRIPSGCDISYTLYDAGYGLSTAQIAQGLESGRHVLVPVSDQGAIDALKDRFGAAVVPTYLFADVNASRSRSLAAHGESSRAAGVDANFAGYVKRIADYRHVILNVRREEMLPQLGSLLEHHRHG